MKKARNAKYRVLLSLKEHRKREGRDSVRKVIPQGGREDLENYMSVHKNDRLR